MHSQLLDDFRQLPTNERLRARYALLIAHLSALDSLRTQRTPSPPPPRAPSSPKLTPGILHATSLHEPLPRLKPQPLATSMMINRRRKQQQSRMDRRAWVGEWARDARAEDEFERMLEKEAGRDGVGMGAGQAGRGGAGASYESEWRRELGRLDACRARETRKSEVSRRLIQRFISLTCGQQCGG